MSFEEIKNCQNQWVWDKEIRTYFWILKVDEETKMIKAKGLRGKETEFLFKANRFFHEIKK